MSQLRMVVGRNLDTTVIHLVFHVSQFCMAVGQTLPVIPLPRGLGEDGIIKVHPTEVLGLR